MFDRLKKLWARIFGEPAPKPTPLPVDPDPVLPATSFIVQWGKDPAQYYKVFMCARRASEQVPGFGEQHGGGWRRGDAEAPNVVDNKVPWLNQQGIAFVTFSTRLGVDSTPPVSVLEQAQDLAAGLAHLKTNGASFGLDTSRFVLSGHSAGAQLVLLDNTSPDLLKATGGDWWCGELSLDTAASDLAQTMKTVPYLSPDKAEVYVDAFGTPPFSGPDYVRQCDPMAQLQGKMKPLLMVVSGKRGGGSLNNAKAFVAKARTFGTIASDPLVVDLEHGEINANLGKTDTPVNAAYTQAVSDWMLPLLRK